MPENFDSRATIFFVAIGVDHLLAGVRKRCLALPEVTEGLTHGGETWLIRRRSFAKFVHPVKHRLDEEHVALWAAAPAGARQELIAEDHAVSRAPKLNLCRPFLALSLHHLSFDAALEPRTRGTRQS